MTRPRPPRRPDPPPLEIDAVTVVAAVTGLWALALVALLPLRGTLDRHDAGWWLWVCAAGVVGGLAGLLITTRRRHRLRAADAGRTGESVS